MMLTVTSWLYPGVVVSKVSVCVIPNVLPVAMLFSKTIVVGPATAVVGASLYAVMLLSAVQVSTCAAAWLTCCRASGCGAAASAGDSHSAGSATHNSTTATAARSAPRSLPVNNCI